VLQDFYSPLLDSICAVKLCFIFLLESISAVKPFFYFSFGQYLCCKTRCLVGALSSLWLCLDICNLNLQILFVAGLILEHLFIYFWLSMIIFY